MNAPPVSIKNLQKTEFLISPIPADNQMNIQGVSIVNKITIIDISGREIDVFYPKSKNFEINTENYISGIYYINLETDLQIVSKKIVIKH